MLRRRPGAYTGADRKARIGKFELANGGTLFLDEIGDMPLTLQAKLLRVLQEHEVEPLGSNKVVKIDVRVIAATSRDLKADVAAGRFRADLYYRLNVLTIQLPALRERTEDFGPLCDHILEQIATRIATHAARAGPWRTGTAQALPLAGQHPRAAQRPEQACMLADGSRLTEADIRGIVIPAELPADMPTTAASEPRGTYEEALAAFERELITRTLQQCGGRVTEAARQLGLGRATLYKKMAALNIPSRSWDAPDPHPRRWTPPCSALRQRFRHIPAAGISGRRCGSGRRYFIYSFQYVAYLAPILL